MWSPCFPRDSSLLFSALSLNQTLCRPEDGHAHWQNWGVYSRLAPLDFEGGTHYCLWKALFTQDMGDLWPDEQQQQMTTGACRFTAQRRALFSTVCENMHARLHLGGRWCKHAGMAALFKSGRVVWTVTLRLRSHRGLQRSCSASITTTAATAGPPKPDRLRQGELSDCRSMPSLLIIQASSHARSKCFNLAHSKQIFPPPPTPSAGFSQMNQALCSRRHILGH